MFPVWIDVSPKQSRSLYFFQKFLLIWICILHTIYWTAKGKKKQSRGQSHFNRLLEGLQVLIDHIILKGIKDWISAKISIIEYWVVLWRHLVSPWLDLFCTQQFSHALPYHLLFIHLINLDSLHTEFSRGRSLRLLSIDHTLNLVLVHKQHELKVKAQHLIKPWEVQHSTLFKM